MNTKKQVIIDGVDVSSCEGLKYKHDGIKKPICTGGGIKSMYRSCLCEGNSNCYFKQLARKTQECEALKAYAQRQENQREEYYKEYLKLSQECEELKEWLQANQPTGICETCMAEAILQNDKYRKALEKIKELIVPVANKNPVYNCWELLNKCDGCGSKKDCGGQSPYYVAKQIVDIIDKAKEEK